MKGIKNEIKQFFNVSKGGVLTMNVERASISVHTIKDETVSVIAELEANTKDESNAREIFNNYSIDFKHTGGDVFIEAEWIGSKRLFSREDTLEIHFTVTVPEKYHLDLKSSGGSISIDKIEGDVKAKTSGGSISVDDVTGTIDAATSGGSVSAYISKQPKSNCILKTSGGSITALLGKGIKLDLDAATSGGGIHTDFPVTMEGEKSNRRLNAKINGGGPKLAMKTSGGSISIKEI